MCEEELDQEQEETEEVEEETSTSKDQKSKASSGFEEAIKKYLDEYASNDERFKAKYENPNKNITECCNYICSEVQKKNVIGLTDAEVYYMARHYYEEENIEVKSTSSCKVVHTGDRIEKPQPKKKEKKITKEVEQITLF